MEYHDITEFEEKFRYLRENMSKEFNNDDAAMKLATAIGVVDNKKIMEGLGSLTYLPKWNHNTALGQYLHNACYESAEIAKNPEFAKEVSETIDMFVKKGADPNELSDSGQSPLFMAFIGYFSAPRQKHYSYNSSRPYPCQGLGVVIEKLLQHATEYQDVKSAEGEHISRWLIERLLPNRVHPRYVVEQCSREVYSEIAFFPHTEIISKIFKENMTSEEGKKAVERLDIFLDQIDLSPKISCFFPYFF